MKAGDQFNTWKVLRIIDSRYAECRCGCGTVKMVQRSHLVYGKSRSCRRCSALAIVERRWNDRGVPRDQRRRVQVMHRNMVTRCSDPTYRDYHRYGGRGIRVDPRLLDFDAFVAYIQKLPGWNDRTLQLDRRDSDKNYMIGNLRFVSAKENARNRVDNVVLTYKGKRYVGSSFRETFCPHYHPSTVTDHIRAGRSAAVILRLYRATLKRRGL